MVNPKDWMVKIFPTFPQRLIDTVCCLAQMYKVELTVGAIKRPNRECDSRSHAIEIPLTAPMT